MAKKHEETNPFVQLYTGFRIEAIWKCEKLITSVADDSERDPNNKTGTQLRAYKFERDNKVTMFTDGLVGMFPNLPAASKDMFMYIAARIQYDCDYIELDEERYCKTMNTSRTTFFNAKRDLINRLIIPRSKRKNTYWINPSYLFKGSRMEKYPEYVRMMNEHPFNKIPEE